MLPDDDAAAPFVSSGEPPASFCASAICFFTLCATSELAPSKGSSVFQRAIAAS